MPGSVLKVLMFLFYMISVLFMISCTISCIISYCEDDCVEVLAPFRAFPNNPTPMQSFNVKTDFDLQGDGLVWYARPHPFFNGTLCLPSLFSAFPPFRSPRCRARAVPYPVPSTAARQPGRPGARARPPGRQSSACVSSPPGAACAGRPPARSGALPPPGGRGGEFCAPAPQKHPRGLRFGP